MYGNTSSGTYAPNLIPGILDMQIARFGPRTMAQTLFRPQPPTITTGIKRAEEYREAFPYLCNWGVGQMGITQMNQSTYSALKVCFTVFIMPHLESTVTFM
jgi:hypothetical protein